MIQLHLTYQIIASQWAGLYPPKTFYQIQFPSTKIHNFFIQGETTGHKATPKRFSMIRKTSKLMEINIFHQINICLFHKQNLCLVETPNLNGKGS